MGTTFGVEADSGGENRVAVFSGQVKVHAVGASPDEFTFIAEGEAVRMEAHEELRRWSNVTVQEQGSPAGSIISIVSDTLDAPRFRRFYAIVPGGWREGAGAFTDKPDVQCRAIPDGAFPHMLQGAELVRTFHADRHDREFALTLSLRDPADLFVIIDTRKAAPQWLKNRFTDTGVRVRVGQWNSPQLPGQPVGQPLNDPHVTCAVWRAVVETGAIVLGPPHESLQRGPNVM